ncbi:MAG: cobalt-precorrin-4 C(11)-methyltransferase [Thermodesulfobacteria bacterium]|nr:cobalt-precorrin-4 C(11)-methyltransferase [Thermodesulfobacteriota bacterium]
MHSGRVYFIGIGPGDPEYLTLKAVKVLKTADIIIYPGSLTTPELINYIKELSTGAEVIDSYGKTLEDLREIFKKAIDGKWIARLVSGDPAFYSSIQEQIEVLRELGVSFEIIPGISSACAGAAKLGIELTWKDVSHTVVFTRFKGKTGGISEKELERIAMKNITMVFFLSVSKIKELQQVLIKKLSEDTPVALVYGVCHRDEKIALTKLKEMDKKAEDLGLKKTTLIYVGKILEGTYKNFGQRSVLYA